MEHTFLIGSSTDEFFDLLNPGTTCTKCDNLETAVQKAAAVARTEKKESPVVLLSPAAASFDQFDNYEERGNKFRSIVEALTLRKVLNEVTSL